MSSTGELGAADGDFGLLSPVSASPGIAALTGDRAVLAAILAVESGWVDVLEKAGLAPTGSSAIVTAAAAVDRYDVADLAVRAQGGGNPVIPLVVDLRKQVRALDTDDVGAVGAVHASLTSQDVLDTALMVLARNALDTVLADVVGATAALSVLSKDHEATLCVGRSLTQHSLPLTFGLRAAQWFNGLAAAGRHLETVELPVQFGGAAGTLAAGTSLTAGTTSDPFMLVESLAEQLGLGTAPAPWHTNRLAVTSLGHALGAVVDAAGKVAADVLFLSRPEVAELAEPRADGRGVSSAMPQKQNPMLSVLIRSASLQAPGLTAQLHLAAANFNDERPDGAWHIEWPAVRQLLRLALGAAAHLRELVEGLVVYPDAMRRNLDLAGPLLMAERVNAAVGPLLPEKDGKSGAQQLQAVVNQTLAARQAEQGSTYRSLLRAAVPADRLSDERIDGLLNPANYLGEADEITRRILAAYPDFVSPTVPVKGATRG